MNLRGQHGYAMVALLVGLSVMAVLMTAVMPTWSQMARREKETELVFRGQQYARAIGLFQRKSGPGVLPPSIDVLVDQHYLRRKYTDPITGDDFNLLSALTQAQPVGTGGAASGQRQPAQSGGVGAVGIPTSSSGRGNAGGIMGVASKSTATSLRIFNGRTHYNEWQFVYVTQTQRPGETGLASQRGGAPGAGLGPQSQQPGPGRGPAPGGNGPGRAGPGGFGSGGSAAPGSGPSPAQPPSGRGSTPTPFSAGPRPRL